MSHIKTLSDLVDLKGLDIVDVGAGSGAFACTLAEQGARVTGIEISAERVAEAQARAGSVAHFLEGRGEALPVKDASADLVCFIHSFHHIPSAHYPDVIAECLRVLRPGGHIYVAEPDLDGAMTQIVQPVDDETDIRTAARAFLDQLTASSGLSCRQNCQYELARVYDGFDAVSRGLIAVDPARAERFPKVRDAMKARFHDLAEATPDGYLVRQGVTAWLFDRI